MGDWTASHVDARKREETGRALVRDAAGATGTASLVSALLGAALLGAMALALLWRMPGQPIAAYVLLALAGALIVALANRMRRTERALRAKEHDLRRMNTLYAALSHINQAIVRLRDRDALLHTVCEVLVKQGPFRMAWIGWHDPETQMLVRVAQSGDDTGYLDGLHISTTADEPSGRGPSGTAFREDRLYVSNDALNDTATLPWRARIVASGYRASAVLPVRAAGVMHGTLQVYADEPNFFQTAELALLTEAATDISFALDTIVETERRREADAVASRERHFASDLVEAMPGIIYLYDKAGRFLRWNRDFERVSQRSGDEIATMQPADFFMEEDVPLLTRKIAEVFERGEAKVEASFRAKDGTATPYLFTGRRISFDGKSCLIGVGVDLSERVQAEEALSKSETRYRYRSTLDNILEGCQLLDFDLRYLYLNQAAETQNRRPKVELLGQRMTDAWPGIESTAVFALIRRCREEGIALHEEVDFHFADGTSGWFDLQIRRVPEGIFVLSIDVTERRRAEHSLRDLNASLELKVASRTQEALARGLELLLQLPDAPLVIDSDPRRVEQILLNLVNNAIKFTDRGSVTVSVTRSAGQGHRAPGDPASARVRIADTGIGISRDDMDNLFQPFRQLDSGLQRRHEGTGLGLAISQRLTALLGGTIEVQSQPGRGSTFTLVLPQSTDEHP